MYPVPLRGLLRLGESKSKLPSMIYFNIDYKTSTHHCNDSALACAFYNSSFFFSYNLQKLAYVSHFMLTNLYT